MCRILAYLGPDMSLEHLLLEPQNSLINQSLDPELHPLLQLAGWGFAAWSDHLLKPEAPLRYRRPMAAFYDDNAQGIIPSLQASTMLAHVRAAGYNSKTVLADENCHPFVFEGTLWIIAQNGGLPNWRLLQRELLPLCEDRYLKQMTGTTDTEFLYVLLLSLLEGDDDAAVQKGFEDLLAAILKAMEALDLFGLTKLKIALVAPNRVIAVNYGCDREGRTDVEGDWEALRSSSPGPSDNALSMLLEPLWVLTGRNFEKTDESYGVETCADGEATTAILASEPLTKNRDDWLTVGFNEIIFMERKDGTISRTVKALDL